MPSLLCQGRSGTPLASGSQPAVSAI